MWNREPRIGLFHLTVGLGVEVGLGLGLSYQIQS